MLKTCGNCSIGEEGTCQECAGDNYGHTTEISNASPACTNWQPIDESIILHFKIKRIIISCKRKEHYEVALKFVYLAQDYLLDNPNLIHRYHEITRWLAFYRGFLYAKIADTEECK